MDKLKEQLQLKIFDCDHDIELAKQENKDWSSFHLMKLVYQDCLKMINDIVKEGK